MKFLFFVSVLTVVVMCTLVLGAPAPATKKGETPPAQPILADHGPEKGSEPLKKHILIGTSFQKSDTPSKESIPTGRVTEKSAAVPKQSTSAESVSKKGVQSSKELIPAGHVSKKSDASSTKSIPPRKKIVILIVGGRPRKKRIYGGMPYTPSLPKALERTETYVKAAEVLPSLRDKKAALLNKTEQLALNGFVESLSSYLEELRGFVRQAEVQRGDSGDLTAPSPALLNQLFDFWKRLLLWNIQFTKLIFRNDEALLSTKAEKKSWITIGRSVEGIRWAIETFSPLKRMVREHAQDIQDLYKKEDQREPWIYRKGR